ncbi:MAG: hypothetical protein H5T78_16335 [Nocardia sp.]|nr:hypothetical protein [Nocardia sp.]
MNDFTVLTSGWRPGGVVNNEMRHLEEAGWARSFRVHGEAGLHFRQVEKL